MAKADKQVQEPVINEIHEYLPRRRLVLLGYLILALLVAVILVFGARTIYRHLHKPAIKFVPANTQPASSNQTKSFGTGTVPKPTGNQNQPVNTGNLPNSGPGQVVGLFVGTSLLAAGLHFVLSLRKYSRTD